MARASTYTDPNSKPKALIFIQRVWLLIKDITKIIYVIAVAAIVIFSIFEIKNAFQIDLVPGVNFIFDDIYREWKNDVLGNTQLLIALQNQVFCA